MSINILDLPVDILVNILKKLRLSDLRNVILTCKTFKNFVLNDNTLWRSVGRDLLILHNSSHGRQNGGKTWYNRCRISHNWCHGYYKNKVLIHFQGNYMPWLKLHDSETLVVSKGSELLSYSIGRNLSKPSLCWSLTVPMVYRHDVRTNDISRFVIRNNTLVCGNRDGNTAVYKVPNLNQEPQLLHSIHDCHENGQVEVSAVELIETNEHCYVVTASIKSLNVRFWKTNSESPSRQESIMDVPVHGGQGVRCMSIHHAMDKLAIGPYGNNKPFLLDVNMGKYLLVSDMATNFKRAIRDIEWHNENTLMYVTSIGMLQLMDMRTHDCVFNIRDPFLSHLYCVKSDGNYGVVVGSAEYSRCVLFDVRNSKKQVQIYFTQKRSSPVYSLAFDSTKLITAVDRGVSALNFNVNTVNVPPRDYSYQFL